MFTNHSCEVVDAVKLDFVKPIGDTVPISTILQKKIMMLVYLILILELAGTLCNLEVSISRTSI